MTKSMRYSPEVRERAVRMVREHEHEHEHTSQWAAIQAIAEKIGCSGETLRNWVRQAERDTGRRPRAWSAGAGAGPRSRRTWRSGRWTWWSVTSGPSGRTSSGCRT